MARPERERKNWCTRCTGFLISTGITVVLLWLTFRTQKPKCFLQSLYIPSLKSTTTTTSQSHHHHNNTIVFLLKLANTNKDKGIKYDAVHLAFRVFINANTTRPLANATLDAFYQGHGKTAEKWGSSEPRGGGVNRTNGDGRIFLRVEFATRVKYKILFFFYTKRHRLSGGANVEVNVSSGEKVDPKGIRFGDIPPWLGSEATTVRGCWVALLRLFVSLLFLTAFTSID